MPGYCWRDGSYGSVPDQAVRAGQDKDGSTIYLGRAFHNGDLIPAKIVPSKGLAFVSWGGEEVHVNTYEVLCDASVAWEFTTNGDIPEGAIAVGMTQDGEKLYAGRVMHDGTLTPGKVHPSHESCYIPYYGEELPFKEYEILILKWAMWVPSGHGGVPPGAVWAGKDQDGGDIFVGRAFHEGDMIPGKVVPGHGGMFVAWGGQEHSKFDYEVYCHPHVAWEQGAYGSVPYGAVVGGHTSSGETLYVGRVLHSGTLTPGKIQPSHRVCYISFGGQEIPFDTYEVLINK
ncbi:uncharacterized protein LOC134527556 [Bacillus rossius redtenbacheri]|uniref:uncharacterized protein LOC134527556 n=1 Tax=Bacillus rossius redtenbacheri TaxID=93214 RepID=UPI002FDCAEE7